MQWAESKTTGRLEHSVLQCTKKQGFVACRMASSAVLRSGQQLFSAAGEPFPVAGLVVLWKRAYCALTLATFGFSGLNLYAGQAPNLRAVPCPISAFVLVYCSAG